MISKLFSESAQGMFNIPELIQMEEAAKQQCQRVLHRSIMHFAEKLFLKTFPLTVSSKRNNCSFQNLLCSNTNEQLRPSYGVMKGFFMLFFLPWIIPSPQDSERNQVPSLGISQEVSWSPSSELKEQDLSLEGWDVSREEHVYYL